MCKKDNSTHCALSLLIQGIVPIFTEWLSGKFRFLFLFSLSVWTTSSAYLYFSFSPQKCASNSFDSHNCMEPLRRLLLRVPVQGDLRESCSLNVGLFAIELR